MLARGTQMRFVEWINYAVWRVPQLWRACAYQAADRAVRFGGGLQGGDLLFVEVYWWKRPVMVSVVGRRRGLLALTETVEVGPFRDAAREKAALVVAQKLRAMLEGCGRRTSA